MEFGWRADSDGKAEVDMVVDLELKGVFCVLGPLLSLVLKKKLGPFVDGIANYKKQ